ncbi:MAG: tRNA lysidine(34) synthetase TilS [Myxococcota bacterium]
MHHLPTAPPYQGRATPTTPFRVSNEGLAWRGRGVARASVVPPPSHRPPAADGPAGALAAIAAEVAAALTERCGVAPGTPLVAACSGGADSVALVHALAASGRWPLGVAFVDHGLRPVEAERAAAQAAARDVGAPFTALAIDLPRGSNLQARARAGRYRALLAHAGAGLVATGHTRSDRAETVLQRLLRGAGPRGLAGLGWRRGRLVRPMLAVARSETRALGLPFADDPSNAGTAYQRNRLRLEVMPLLARENPSIEAALADLADTLEAQRDLLDALVAHVDPSRVDLRGLSPSAALAFTHALSAVHGGGVTPRRAALEAWARALRDGRDAGTYPLGQDLVGLARAGHAALSHVTDPRSRVVAWGPGTYRQRHVSLEVAQMPFAPDAATNDEPTAWLDARSVAWPLALERTGPGGHAGVDALGGHPIEPAVPDAGAIDLATGLMSTGYRVVDGAGRVVLPVPDGAPLGAERVSDSEILRVRIVVRRDEEVVAEPVAKLPSTRSDV